MLLGQLVNVVARGAQSRLAGYLRAARPPALRLLGLYCLQVGTGTVLGGVGGAGGLHPAPRPKPPARFPQGLLTFGYIALLSRVGEQVAASMRKALFISLLRYDAPGGDTNEGRWGKSRCSPPTHPAAVPQAGRGVL